MSKLDYDYTFKLLLVGNSGTGKSSILLKYADNNFSTQYLSTIGVDFKIKTVKIDDKIIKLQMWDTAGQERFRTITSSYYRGADAVLIVYSVNDRESYNHVHNWLKEINMYSSSDIIKILVGNKCDLIEKREVSYAEVKQFADSNEMVFVETSAKQGLNIESLFTMVATRLREKINADPKNESLNTTPLYLEYNIDTEKTGRCCS